MRKRIIIFFLPVLVLLSTSFVTRNGYPDISTPEKSYASFVHALKSDAAGDLERIVTPTGLTSLDELKTHTEYAGGLPDLGQELEYATVRWDKITDDIYFVLARREARVHKMEFTREEPGWMLYHWQIGGGVDKQAP